MQRDVLCYNSRTNGCYRITGCSPRRRLCNRNRYYHNGIGRWVNRDPIGYAGGDLNLYGYVGNMPARGLDPSGLCRIVGTDANGNTIYSNVGINGQPCNPRFPIGACYINVPRSGLQRVPCPGDGGPVGPVDVDPVFWEVRWCTRWERHFPREGLFILWPIGTTIDEWRTVDYQVLTCHLRSIGVNDSGPIAMWNVHTFDNPTSKIVDEVFDAQEQGTPITCSKKVKCSQDCSKKGCPNWTVEWEEWVPGYMVHNPNSIPTIYCQALRPKKACAGSFERCKNP